MTANAAADANRLYCYRVEPLRPALILIGVLLLVTALTPAGWRGLVAIFLSGPLVWLLLQVLRRRVGVTLRADRIEVRSSVTRGLRRISLTQIRSALLLPDDRLVIAYWQPRPTTPGGSDPRPPRQRIVVTAALDDAPGLLAALPKIALTTQDLSADKLRQALQIRRARRLIYAVLIILIGIPAVLTLVLHLLASLGVFNVSAL